MKKYTLFIGIAMLLFMVSCQKDGINDVELETYGDDRKEKEWDTRPHIISVDSTANDN